MGIKGIWKFLEPTGKTVSPEYFSGKTFAVDISTWLYQFSKGMRDSDGNPLLNNHLIGMFKRICKLLYFGIKPVFVFDGAVPMLKKQVLLKRQKRRAQYSQDSRQAARKLVTVLLRKHAIQNLSLEAGQQLKVPSKKKQQDDDIFILPSIDYPLRCGDDNDSDQRNGVHATQEDDYHLTKYGFDQNIDLNSKEFHDLPATLKLELLIDYKEKEKNKNTDWDDLQEIPENSDDFSNYQLQRLLKSNEITTRINDLRREINKMAEHDDDPDNFGSRIFSSADTRYMLKRKRQTHLEKWEDKFLKKFCSEAPQNPAEQAPWTFNISKSSIDFKNFYGIDQLDDRFKVIPEVVREMDLKTMSLNFQPGGKVRSEERKEAKDALTSRVQMESESDDDDGDFIEVGPPPPSGQESFKNNYEETNSMLDIVNINHSINQSGGSSLSSDWSITYGSIICSNDQMASPQLEIKNDPMHVLETLNAVENEQCSLSNLDCTERGNDGMKIINEDIFSKESAHGDHPNPLTDHNVAFVTEEITEEIEAANEIDAALQLNSHIKVVENSFDQSDNTTGTGIPSTNEIDVVPTNEGLADECDYKEEEEVKELFAEVLEACKEDGKVSLESMEQKLASKVKELRSEVGKNDRLAATTITEQVHREVQTLLRLFGVPYLVSPGEAEAQCAYLDHTGQTDGTITDDSDVFLFGGRKVVRHLFNRDEVTEMYDMGDVEKKLLLNQNNLICMAMLCGCDYTEGVRNVGPVTATEIIQEFKGHDMDCLVKFRDWLDEAKEQKSPPANETKVKSQLRRLHLFDGFPNPSVFNSYKHPTVDASMETFTWRKPDLEKLEQFALKTLNWSNKQTNDMIGPLVKKLEKSSNQSHVTNYFNSASVPSSLGVKLKSKRVRRVVNLRKSERKKEEEINKVAPKSFKDLKKATSSKKNRKIESPNHANKADVTRREMDLSEESSDGGDYDDDNISDEILASIDDVDAIIEKAECTNSKL